MSCVLHNEDCMKVLKIIPIGLIDLVDTDPPYMEALKAGKDRAKIRSKTFHGVAVAMAKQWTEDLSK